MQDTDRLNAGAAAFIIPVDNRRRREDHRIMEQDDRPDLGSELKRLKERARGVFGGQKAPESGAPPVPEAPKADEGSPAGRPAKPQVPVLADIPVTDDQIFIEPPGGLIEDIVPGEAIETGAGILWRVRERAGNIWERGAAAHAEYIAAIASSPVKMPPTCRSFEALVKAPAGSVAYLDLETTGLRNTPLFLIGLMYSEGEELILDQLFARDYTEERAVLSFVSQLLDSREVLVTFNGNTFDVPFLADRMTFHDLPMVMPRSHVDLLPVSRSLMKGRTPDNRLQTLERFVLGRKRTGDIPGSEIPGAYHEFVRTKNARQMAAVIHHNRLDLLSMMELITVYLTHI